MNLLVHKNFLLKYLERWRELEPSLIITGRSYMQTMIFFLYWGLIHENQFWEKDRERLFHVCIQLKNHRGVELLTRAPTVELLMQSLKVRKRESNQLKRHISPPYQRGNTKAGILTLYQRRYLLMVTSFLFLFCRISVT